MSAYDGHLSREGHHSVSEAEVQEMAKQKAHELFSVCDIEQKGFITKRDMQRLQNELPLQPEQLEAVFDSLDDDGNGYLTLEEFTEGFGSYLGINFMGDSTMEENDTLENIYEGEENQEEEKQFTDMMENIGARCLFDDENTIKHLWMKIRRDEPEMVGNFEEFLYKISSDLRKTKVDFDTLENALKSKSTAHDEEVRKLYEEMEYQIKREKERILSEEQLKERQVREALESDLAEKDKQLQDLLNKHQDMESRLETLNQTDVETKQENEKLAKEKEDLEDMLMKSQEGLEDSKLYIDQLRKQQKNDKQERARAAIKLTESIALERESLVKQLDTLKDVNKKLRDDKDEAEIRRILEAETSPFKSNRKKELCKQGSILGDYFPTSRRKFESTAESIEESLVGEYGEEHGLTDDDIECDDDLLETECENVNNNNNNNKLLYEDSEIKPSYYGHDIDLPPSKTDQSSGSNDEISEEDEDNKGSKKSRSKSKRRKQTKKPGFHPVSTHDKRLVPPPVEDGDSYEEEGDNIDMMVAPVFEESITSTHQSGEPLSLYFESLHDNELANHVEMQTIAVQTTEEMVPKSELQLLIKSLSVDSSTNTEAIDSTHTDLTQNSDLKNVAASTSIDCATNTDIVDAAENANTRSKSPPCSVDIATNTDILEPHSEKESSSGSQCSVDIATNNDMLEPLYEKDSSSVMNSVDTSTNSNMLESKPEKGHESKLSRKETFTNSVILEPPSQKESVYEWPNADASTIKDSTESTQNRGDNYQNLTNIPVEKENFQNQMDSKPTRHSRVRGLERGQKFVEMDNFASLVGIKTSKLDYDLRSVKPVIGPSSDRIGVHDNDKEAIQGTRGQPVGADIETDDQGLEVTVALRQRIFKVVFVGDSGVGKSSFIHRFCNDHFNPTFSATIGVDFQVKNLILGGQSIVLQLWDTAGQERFRSITKQYFRKADGVVVMYDVNSESTFTNVRNWMESVQEGVEEGTAILMIGNKTDMADSESDRAVKTKDGNKLSVDYDAIFYETSAKSGTNIRESMEAMASILREKEDKEMEKAVLLDDVTKKKKFCCG